MLCMYIYIICQWFICVWFSGSTFKTHGPGSPLNRKDAIATTAARWIPHRLPVESPQCVLWTVSGGWNLFCQAHASLASQSFEEEPGRCDEPTPWKERSFFWILLLCPQCQWKECSLPPTRFDIEQDVAASAILACRCCIVLLPSNRDQKTHTACRRGDHYFPFAQASSFSQIWFCLCAVCLAL